MGMPQQWDGHAIENRQIASAFGDAECNRVLNEPLNAPKMAGFMARATSLMPKSLPRLPDTRVEHIPANELPGWARELDIDAAGLDEAMLRLRLKQECDRLFPVVHADFIQAYNKMQAADGFPLAEWSHL